MKKIGFITDTNILKKKFDNLYKEKEYLNYIDFFLEYIDNLKKADNQTNLIYYMPTIILQELYYQKLEIFNNKYKKLCNDFKTLEYGIEGDLPKNIIESILKKELQKYKSKLKIIELKYSENLFEELVNDALMKNPPFDKSTDGKKTDAGYKDALIWKSILNNSDIDKCEKLYFFSGDKIFYENTEYLKNEFKKTHPNVDLIIKDIEINGDQRQTCLKTIIKENNLIETDIIKLYNKKEIKRFFQNINYENYNENVLYQFNNIDVLVKNINFKEFDSTDFYIDNVIEDEENYIVKVNFSTLKYSFEEDITISIKERILGNITLYLNKENSSFTLVNYKINNVHFISTYFNELSTNISKAIDNLNINYNLQISKKVEEIQEQITNSFSSALENISNPLENIQNKIFNPLSATLEEINTSNKKLQEQIKESFSSSIQRSDNNKDSSNYLNTGDENKDDNKDNNKSNRI